MTPAARIRVLMSALRTPPSLRSILEARISSAGVSARQQTEALRELFELFTGERGRLGRLNYLDVPRYRMAYLRYHLPLNVARAICVLKDLLRTHPEVADCDNVVDLGSGPGSSSLATLFALPRTRRRRFLLTDRSRGALRLARELIEGCATREGMRSTELSCRVQKLPALPRLPPRGLVWLSMVLNELRAPGRGGLDIGNLLRRLEAGLSPPGIVAVIEPALRAPGRQLLEIHDRLASSPRWEVLAPCTHQKACPLLQARNRPWCHFHLRWQADGLVEEIAAPLRLRYDKVSFSYLVVRRLAAGDEKPRSPPGAARVIGDAMKVAGGGVGAYVCRDGRRTTLTTLRRTLRRGDLIVSSGDRLERVEQSWPGFRTDS